MSECAGALTARLEDVAAHYIATARRLLRRCGAVPVVMLCLLLLPLPAPAQPGPPYGERLLRVGASWPREAPPAPVPLELSAESDLGALRARIEEIELEGGPFASGLSESLGDLARRLEAAGDFEEATAVRERALYLARVNEGLQSPTQLPLLRDQLRTDRLSGDYAALDARYDYYWRLFGAGTAPYTPLRVAAQIEYLRWQREALRRSLENDNTDRLLRLLELGDDFLEGLREAGDQVPKNALRDAVQSVVKNYYLLATLVQPSQEPLDTRFRQPRSFSQDFNDWNPQRERLENLRRGVERRGRTLYDELLAVTGEPLPRASLLRDFGDWSQWWGDRSRARDAYEESWRVLEASGNLAVAERWYAEPRPLPDNGVFVVPGDPEGVAVALRVEVDDTGRARPSVIDPAAAEVRANKRLVRYLRSVHFRPALRDGKVTTATLDPVSYQLVE